MTKFSAGVIVTAPTTMHAEERQRECSQRHSEVRAGNPSDRFRLRVYRTVQTRPVSSRSVQPRGFPRRPFLYPVPSAAARTTPKGVKERASFCLVFRSLNTTSSHRLFSMSYKRAKSNQGNTNFQKKFGKHLWDHYPRALNSRSAPPKALVASILHGEGQ